MGRHSSRHQFMRPRIYILIVAALALLLNSVCLCAAATHDCTAASCAPHEHSGTCPAQQQRGESRGNHECCQTAACSPVAIGADTDSLAAAHFPVMLPVIFRAPIIDLVSALARFGPITD